MDLFDFLFMLQMSANPLQKKKNPQDEKIYSFS